MEKKIIFLAGYFFLLSFLTVAQPSRQWNTSVNGTEEEAHGHYIIQCSDGGFVQVGETGFIDNNSAKLMVAKVNSNGSLQWKKEFGSRGHNLGNCVVETPDGNLVVAGALNKNSVLIKLNSSNGNTIWQKTYSQSGEDALEGVDVDENGGLIAVGYKNGTAESTFYVEGQGYILKTDASGNTISGWPKDKNSQIGQGYRVKTVSDGYIFQGLDGSSFLLLKTDFSGNNIWSNSYGTSSDEHNFGMDVNFVTGDIFLTGHTQSGVNWDTYTMKINSSGVQQWAQRRGNPRGYDERYIHDEGWGVRATPDGGCLIVAGTGDEHTYSDCSGSPGCSDQWCVYLIKYSSDGTREWEVIDTDSGGNDWAGEDVAITSDGGCIVANDNGSFAFTKYSSFTSTTSYTLTTSSSLGGSVTSGGTYDEGTVVSITATPDSGYQFDNWSGDASGTTNPLSIIMDDNKTITASFIENKFPSNPKIMPLGASRVEGNRPDYESFRYELWKNILDNGWSFDYIGTMTDPASYTNYSGQVFDKHHEGHEGYTSGQILANLDEWISIAGTPDIVLFSSPGGNDALEELPVDEAISNINGIIDALQAANPDVTIFIEQPAPGHSDIMTAELTAYIKQLQSEVLKIANQQTTTSSYVIAIDMFTGWSDAYLADDVHYNTTGAKVVADRYDAAMEAFYPGGSTTDVKKKDSPAFSLIYPNPVKKELQIVCDEIIKS